MKKERSYHTKYILIFASLLIFTILNLVLGSIILPIGDIFNAITGGDAPRVVSDILFSLRIPKAITALLAGAALSVCGLQMQTLFRNPLADPYILGISSGAGLGVAIFLMGFSAFGITIPSTLFSNIGIAASAWIGAFSVTLLILLVSSRLKDNISLLIFGIMLGSVIGAIISLLQYFSASNDLKIFVIWTMGSFSVLSPIKIWIMFILIVIGFALSVYNIKDLNALLMGEAYAKSLGVNMESTRRRILIATTLLAGSVTAFCGPIGFIGIAVPHIARLVFRNADHKVLLPATAFLGASIMIFADTVAQLPGHSGVIPINTVSALIGVPVILFIILKSRFI
ncbi:MAG: iron ABC transporter [Bacteroidetes bacterium HGW-Bacteroidetes-5]|nr:MAG: iron ABC transporter [Bacteroidetes bacterium HGW-Bacteroidetes-5]